MKRKYKVIVLTLLLLFYLIIKIKNITIPCIFKSIFHIACPMCGFTRSIKAFLNGDIMLSLHYNLLGIIGFIFIIYNIILLIYDIIFNKKKIEKLYNTLGKYYIFIITLFIINMIINNIRGI